MKLRPCLLLAAALGGCDDADLLGDVAREATRPASAQAARAPRPHAQPPAGAAAELHVIGVYAARAPGAPISVVVDRPGRHVVVVSAFEPVRWDVRAAGPATTIERVVLVGHRRQTLATRTTAAVESRSFDERTLGRLPACGYSLPYNGGACDTERLLAGIEEELGLPVTSFCGTYQGSGFVLRADGDADVGTSRGYARYHVTRPRSAPRACRPAARPAPLVPDGRRDEAE